MMRLLTLVILVAFVGCTTINHWSTPRGTPAESCMGQCMADDTASVGYCARTCRGVTAGEGRCAPYDEIPHLACHEHQELRVGTTLLIVFASLIAVGALGYLAVRASVDEGGDWQ